MWLQNAWFIHLRLKHGFYLSSGPCLDNVFTTAKEKEKEKEKAGVNYEIA